jgi:hypothetical protein
MEARTKMDLALGQQISQRQESALAAIARYRTPTGAAIVPVWFALLMAEFRDAALAYTRTVA